MQILVAEEREEAMMVRDIRAMECHRCDFGTGKRGMDRCSTCDGTGSVLRVGKRFFANTEHGHELASVYLKENLGKDD